MNKKEEKNMILVFSVQWPSLAQGEFSYLNLLHTCSSTFSSFYSHMNHTWCSGLQNIFSFLFQNLMQYSITFAQHVFQKK